MACLRLNVDTRIADWVKWAQGHKEEITDGRVDWEIEGRPGDAN